jgi:cell division protein ZapE
VADLETSPLEWYRRHTEQAGFVQDSAQQSAVQHLERLHHDLVIFKRKRHRPLGKVLPVPKLPRGLYFWGGVGRGKSFLMDGFFNTLPYQRKRRVHFHRFMQEIHEELKTLKNEPDPLATVARRIAIKNRVVCFDEFHVSDIADAMILARLLDWLFKLGVVFVMTSNYRPDDLYPNGLQRNNFLPAIDLLRQHMDVINVDGGTDYRLRHLKQIDVYLAPHGAEAEAKLEQAFAGIAHGPELDHDMEIEGRHMHARRHALGVVWFDFMALCGPPRSQNDYLDLARQHHTILVSDVPKMGLDLASEARRFTWLVDVCYDNRVKLILSAAVPAEELYLEGPNSGEFHRTLSRLQEMRSEQYLGLAHMSLADNWNTI